MAYVGHDCESPTVLREATQLPRASIGNIQVDVAPNRATVPRARSPLPAHFTPLQLQPGKLHLERARVERLSQVPEEAMGPPPKPDYAGRESRRVTIADVGLSSAFRIRCSGTDFVHLGRK